MDPARYEPFSQRPQLGAERLSSFASDLGANTTQDLKEHLLEIMHRADARYMPPQSWDLPQAEKEISLAWQRVRAALPRLEELNQLFEPQLNFRQAGGRDDFRLVCAACWLLRPFDAHTEKMASFVDAALRRGARMHDDEKALWITCKSQQHLFRQGRSAFLSDAEIALLNDFYKFREEFIAKWREQPVAMQQSSFQWVYRGGEWLPKRISSRYRNMTAIDLSSHWCENLLRPDKLPRDPVVAQTDTYILRLLHEHAKLRETLKRDGEDVTRNAVLSDERNRVLAELRRKFPIPTDFPEE